jgi:hypothetical protein
MPALPPGVRHYQTQGFAESLAAYDRLTEAAGWQEREGEGYACKEKHVGHARLVVFRPVGGAQ